MNACARDLARFGLMLLDNGASLEALGLNAGAKISLVPNF